MDGVFMKKCMRRLAFLAIAVCCFYAGSFVAGKYDPAVRLQVGDVVLATLQQALQDATDIEQAKSYMKTHLPRIQETANKVMKEMDCLDSIVLESNAYRFRFYFLELLGRMENFFAGE
jgi:hypothetical protein